MAKFKAKDIVWATDGEDVSLPATVEVEADDIEDVVDILSDTFGWLIESLSIEPEE